jgi:hypothetical protein
MQITRYMVICLNISFNLAWVLFTEINRKKNKKF